MRFLAPFLAVAVLAGAGYVFVTPSSKLRIPGFSSDENSSMEVLNLANSRPLHNVKVIRCETDGYVVSSVEGTFKLWHRQLTPQAFETLKKTAPTEASTPPKSKSLFATPASLMGTPSPKGAKSSLMGH